MEVKKEFVELINTLQSNNKIDMIEAKMQPGLSPNEITEMEKKSGAKLSGPIRKFYSEVDGIIIQWAVKRDKLQGIKDADSNQDMVGAINILSLERMLFGGNEEQPWKENLWFDFMEEDEVENLKKIRPFDLYNNDDKEFVGFKIQNKEFLQTLSYYNLEDGVFQFKMDLEKYLQSLIDFKGFMFWQRAFLFKKSKYLKELHHYFPQIFPGGKIPL